MKEKWSALMEKDGAKTVVASLISIFIGLLVGCVIVLIVGLTNPLEISPSDSTPPTWAICCSGPRR